MLQVQHLTLTHTKDLRTLVDDQSFTVSGQDRLAVIGEEGDGKSTLLSVIAFWPESPAYCQVTGHVSGGGEHFAYLAQDQNVVNTSVYEFCMRDPFFASALWEDLADACRQVDLDMDLPYASSDYTLLSGGEKVRLQLMLLLLHSPSFLLLDEPSNDLDIEALEMLERFLLNCRLPVIYISHDEMLLRRTATRVLHLESVHGRSTPRWTLANVPYERYVTERQLSLARQEDQYQQDLRAKRIRDEKYQRIEQAVEHAQATISRQDPHGGRLLKKKMKAVKSLEHRFAREDEERGERPNVEWAMDASWMEGISLPAGKTILSLDLPGLHAGERTLTGPIHLLVRGAEHVMITGKNGAGKTTLMREIYSALRSRTDIRCGYMPQHYEDLMDPSLTPIDFLHTEGTKEQLTQLRIHLGAFRFTREEMEHPISALSGGQKAKLLLLRLILEKCDVLLLDEPTRNLSPLSAPILRDMIEHFPGAVICITHDRIFLEETGAKVLELTKEGLSPRSSHPSKAKG